ncbi:hypothetical protein, partial [Neisseria gonorrhoeae]
PFVLPAAGRLVLIFVNPLYFPPSQKRRAAGIYRKNSTSPPSFPRKRESRFVRFRLFPIDSCRVGGLDSRLRGNDGTLGFCFCFSVFAGMTGKLAVVSYGVVFVFG